MLFTQIPEDSLFHCRVMYEDSLYAPLLGRQELQENVGIYLEENYEQINVPVPNFGGSDPADIVHDFHRVWRKSPILFCSAVCLSLTHCGCIVTLCFVTVDNVGIYMTRISISYFYVVVAYLCLNFSTPPCSQGLTAYHDIALDKCYVVELNTTVVMPPRNLWELLINVQVRCSSTESVTSSESQVLS